MCVAVPTVCVHVCVVVVVAGADRKSPTQHLIHGAILKVNLRHKFYQL